MNMNSSCVHSLSVSSAFVRQPYNCHELGFEKALGSEPECHHGTSVLGWGKEMELKMPDDSFIEVVDVLDLCESESRQFTDGARMQRRPS